MTDEEKIKRVLYQYENGGLVSMNIVQVLECLDEQLIGIGIGEQGFVTSQEDVRRVFFSGLKNDRVTKHSVSFDQIHILIHEEGFANLCAKVIVHARKGGNTSVSEFMQTLTFVRRGADWKICALHASAPVVTEESVEAYPLKFAEKTLQMMKDKIGEAAYLAEEQYRQAILADTVAFYIINFSTDTFEKCQLNSDLCVTVEPGTPYESFVLENSPQYLLEEDRDLFIEAFSLQHVWEAFETGKNELNCEYRLKQTGGSFVWMLTTVRLITDAVTHEKKGIMYVKNIDESKRRELAMIDKAERDEMTGVLNKPAFLRHVMDAGSKGIFIMLDVDNFKIVNDTLGHPAGDQVLIAVSRILDETFAEEGSAVGRLGGDEFAAFLAEEPPRADLNRKLAGFLDRIGGMEIGGVGRVNISCSIGVASCAGKTMEQSYQDADDALYCSKQRGKNRFSFYKEQPNA